jgi:CubicO group peptidase (beta-lactamase class C family)
VEEIITGPLKMESTAQHLNSVLNNRFVKVYGRWGNRVAPWDFDALAACGSLKSSVNDLLLYAKANMVHGDDRLSNAFDLTHQITYSKTRKLGLGWLLLTLNGDDYCWHNGGTGGCRSFIIFNSQKDIAIIILANTAISCDGLAIAILKSMQQ